MKQKELGRIAVLGAGKLGESLIAGIIDSGLVTRDQLVATAKHAERLESLASRLKIATTLDNAGAVRGAAVVILAVKPQAMEEVLRAIRGRVTRRQLVLSVAASVDTSFIEKRLGPRVPVVRAMPFPDGGQRLLLGRARTGGSGRVAGNSGSCVRLRAGQAGAAGARRSSRGPSFLGLRPGADRPPVVPPGSRSVGPCVPP